MRIFISHKLEDAATANLIAKELQEIKVECYLDLLDNSITENGKALTDHIRANLNDCTDIIVVMSNITRFSQWVPFEVGMAAQKDMPTATFLKARTKASSPHPRRQAPRSSSLRAPSARSRPPIRSLPAVRRRHRARAEACSAISA